MATDSTTAGFLVSPTAIDYDQQLEDAINPTIAGITGLNGDTHVVPRFQPNPPVQKGRDEAWCAFGFNRTSSDTSASVTRASDNTVAVTRYHEFEFLFSFYGPTASGLAEAFRDGLMIEQNRYLLEAASIAIVSIGEARKAPALFMEKWLTKVDMTIMFRRQTVRIYPVVTLTSAGIGLNTDPVGETPTQINVS